MERKVRWGVIGSGGIARRRTIPEGIAPAANATLAAVHDVDAAVNRAVAGEFRARAAGSIEELLGAGIDAVYIATPVHRHREGVLASAAAGKHVLCEKSLGLDVAEAEEMVRACRAARVRLGLGLMMRFHAGHRAARDLIGAGRIGRPVHARAQLSCWYPPLDGAWRQDPEKGGGGSLIDMGSHSIDLLEMLLGPVSRVSCFTARAVHGYPVEDGAVALIEFAGGALGTVDSFFSIPDAASANVLEVHGSGGSILARGTIGQGSGGEMRLHASDPGAAYSARQERSGPEGTLLAFEPVNPYRAEIEEFGRAVLEDREPEVGAEAALRSQRVIAACYESARTGAAVMLGASSRSQMTHPQPWRGSGTDREG